MAEYNDQGGNYAPPMQNPYAQTNRYHGGGGKGYRGGGGGGFGGAPYYQRDGGYNQQQNREQREENRIRQIRATLFKLGEDKDFHPPSDLLKMAKWVQDRAKEGVESVTSAFRIMVTEQPHKTPLIAALIGFLCLSPQFSRDDRKTNGGDGDEPFEHHPDDEQYQQQQNQDEQETVGIQIVRDLVKAFRTYLDARLWRNTRLILHMFAALVPLQIIPASSLRSLLASFAAVLEEPGVTASRGDRAAICIIETLCRGGQDLLYDHASDQDPTSNADNEQAHRELDNLVEKVLSYDSTRKVEVELASALGGPIPNSPIHEESFEDCVKALEVLKAQNYRRVAFLPTPRDLLPAAISPSSSSLTEEKRSVILPDILVPPDEDLEGEGVDVTFAQLGQSVGDRDKKHTRTGKIDTGKGEADQRRTGVGPERMGRQLRWFQDSVPKVATPSSVVLRAIFSDMVDLYESNRKEAARMILELPLWLRRGTFGGKVSPDEGLFGEAEEEWWYVPSVQDDAERSVEGGWSLDDIIIETVLSALSILPNSPRNCLYYATLMREIVSVTPGTIAPSLGRTIRIFHSAMATGKISGEVLRRFSDWFAIHLSNFNFGWAWQEWVGDAHLPVPHPRRSFIRRVVELEVRLAYYDRIKQTLPQEIQDCALPPEEPLPAFTYADEGHPYHEQASRLINSIKAKAAAEVIMADFESFKPKILVDSTLMPTDDDENIGKVQNESQAELVVRDIMIQSILFVGSRSFSHFLNIVERYHALLRQLSSSSRMRMAMLCGATRFWSRSPQWIQIVVDKLLQYRIVEPTDVIDFVFSPPQDEPLTILSNGSGDSVANSFSKTPSEHTDGKFLRDWSSFNWWVVVQLTLNKVNGRVDQLQKRLEDIEREEAVERERKEAAAVAGLDEDHVEIIQEETPVDVLPLFPTSALLPPRPDAVEEKKKAAATSEEAKASLEAIQVEQRKVLVGVIQALVDLVRSSNAFDLSQDVESFSNADWQAWWIKTWYLECVRSFNKQILANREVIIANVFTSSTDEPIREILERAIDMLGE